MQILIHSNITVEQAIAALVAIPAFLPAAFCTGYLSGWFTDLHGFRRRSLAERICWSIPLSFAVSPIATALLGRFLSLEAVTVCYALVVFVWLGVLSNETIQLRKANRRWLIGWKPLGGWALAISILWVALVILSLVDLQHGSDLYSSLFLFDHSARINWTESILRSGVPPQNSIYFYRHPAPMRNYYFWYAVCAAVAKLFHLPARAVVTASCVWDGFALAAILGLYLKYMLGAGQRLRRQFLVAVAVLGVTGLDICVNIAEIFLHRPLPLDLEWWSRQSIYSWYGSMLWVPHHMTALVCCMFAFLIAWLSAPGSEHGRTEEIAFICLALASAFGLSIFVPFGFFLVMVAWAFWQVLAERRPRPVIQMAIGGLLSIILLIPYLSELMHNSTPDNVGSSHGVTVESLFSFSIREMIPAGPLLRQPAMRPFVLTHPQTAQAVARLFLLVPGYFIELGFFAVVLLVYLCPSLRPVRRLTPAQRVLVFLAIAAIPFISFIRSNILGTNDFGWRAALLLQFPLVLLASDLLMHWRTQRRGPTAPALGSRQNAIRGLAHITLAIGVVSTLSQAIWLRIDSPLLEYGFRAAHSPQVGIVSHNAYISYLGYAELDRIAPANAIVQYNPGDASKVWKSIDVVNVDHQIAIASNQLWCGATLGGDPSGCPGMIAAIDPLFKGAPAAQARAVCSKYGIHYLIAKIYDPAWNDTNGWVWTLPAAVNQPEFRALECQ